MQIYAWMTLIDLIDISSVDIFVESLHYVIWPKKLFLLFSSNCNHIVNYNAVIIYIIIKLKFLI